MYRSVALLLAIGVLVQFGILVYVYQESQNGRNALIKSQREGCERSKKDRADNARFQRAHSKYIRKVTGAKSVQEDVKKAAREAQRIYRVTSRRLSIRANINCKEAFP